MKSLLIATAAIEVTTGLALVMWPSELIATLLGSSLDAPAGLTVARVAGAALLSLGCACWFARVDGQSRAATGLVAAMLLYNIAIVAVLASARFGSGLVSIAFWPVVALHTGMAVWSIACLRGKRANAR